MGQKCSCLINEFEKMSEKKLEDESFNRIELLKNQSNKENFENASFIQSKLKANTETLNNFSQRNNQNSCSLEAQNYLKTDNSLNKAMTNFKEKQKLEKEGTNMHIDVHTVNILIRNISNWFYKKKFVENIKEKLEEANENLFKNLIKSEIVQHLEALASKCIKPFSIYDWKNYYKEMPINLSNVSFAGKNPKNIDKQSGFNLEFIFGKTYKSRKIFMGKNFFKQASNSDINNKKDDTRSIANDNLNKDLLAGKDNYNAPSAEEINNKNAKKKQEMRNYVYVGEVNNYNQKHGKGVLFYLDGTSREEGTWYEDELIGWIRVIFSVGNVLVIEGIFNFFIYFINCLFKFIKKN